MDKYVVGDFQSERTIVMLLDWCSNKSSRQVRQDSAKMKFHTK